MAISNLSYDVLTTLQSKLEAVWVYDQFIEDCREAGDDACVRLFEEMKSEDQRHAQRLTAELERLVREGMFQEAPITGSRSSRTT